MKKNILMVLVALLLLTGCEKKVDCNPKKSENVGNVCNLKESKEELPSLDFLLLGLMSANIRNEQFEGLKIYTFDAVTKNNGEVIKHNYTGIKLKDFLEKQNITFDKKFGSLVFSSVNYTKVEYKKEDIDDNMWLVFQIDNKEIKLNDNKSYLTLINTELDTNSWAYGIQNIIIKK
ncbi:MAG: hypothetical protein RR478_00140 [Bacilli bacterium]